MNLEFTEQQKAQIERMVQDALPTVQECIKANLSYCVEYTVKEKLEKEIGVFIHNWVATNLFPEIEKSLMESKSGLLVLAQNVAAECCVTLQAGLVAALKENLKHSYNRKEIIKKMFE